MAGRRTPGSKTALPPRLRRLMDPGERRLSDQVALELSDREVSALREVVGERAGRPDDVSLSRAISVLAVRDHSPETAAVLSRFAADDREAPVERAVAAASLRLIPGPEARDGLVRSLRSAEPIVRVEAIKSLGCIGDAATLDALNAVGRGANAGEERQLAFAQRVDRPPTWTRVRPRAVPALVSRDGQVRRTSSFPCRSARFGHGRSRSSASGSMAATSGSRSARRSASICLRARRAGQCS